MVVKNAALTLKMEIMNLHELKILMLALLIGVYQGCLANTYSVAVDIGHSKQNPGATSARGKPEFDFNRDLASILQQVLSADNIMSFSIGEHGDIVDAKQRSAIANAQNARFFVSIHHDSAQLKYFKIWRWQDIDRPYCDQFSGFSLFVSRKNPQLQKSLHCARMIGQALRQKGFTPTHHHAEPIAGENRTWADQQNGVYYYDNLAVLKTTNMPAVLIEAGVIVNRNDEKMLEQFSTRHRIASAIIQGIRDCKVLD